jgi:hypothetical protein
MLFQLLNDPKSLVIARNPVIPTLFTKEFAVDQQSPGQNQVEAPKVTVEFHVLLDS